MTREIAIRYCDEYLTRNIADIDKEFLKIAKEALQQEHSMWIPVSERLPEIHQDVLLSLRSLDVEVGFRGNTEPYYYCHGDYIEPKNVLAWQPLPEPYKEEGSEGEK